MEENTENVEQENLDNEHNSLEEHGEQQQEQKEQKQKGLSRRKMIAGIIGTGVLVGAGTAAGIYYNEYDWNIDRGNDALKYRAEQGHWPADEKFVPPKPNTYQAPKANSSEEKKITQKAVEQAKTKYPETAKVNIPEKYAGVDTGRGPVTTEIPGLVMPNSYKPRTDTTNNAKMSLSIPSINLWAGLVSNGAVNHQIQIARSGEATLYNQSAPIGSKKGSTIIAGHVNYANAAPTVFWNLGSVQQGALIYATGPDGKTHKYSAVSTHSYNKQALPDEMYTRTGDPYLYILTCSGLTYTPGAGWEFPNNLVLKAKLID